MTVILDSNTTAYSRKAKSVNLKETAFFFEDSKDINFISLFYKTSLCDRG